jgi:hypothetical protein
MPRSLIAGFYHKKSNDQEEMDCDELIKLCCDESDYNYILIPTFKYPQDPNLKIPFFPLNLLHVTSICKNFNSILLINLTNSFVSN